MAETPTDHDRIITLEAHVQDLRDWRGVLTTHLDTQFHTMDAKIDGRFSAIDAKLDQKMDTLQAHVDTSFERLETKVASALASVRAALPIWSQIAIVGLVGLLGAAVTWAATGHP